MGQFLRCGTKFLHARQRRGHLLRRHRSTRKVTIDGKPITLNPDGSFRYHFIFPDGVYEIPIVAVSPDGVESRSAILRFQRGTQKSGKVDDTAQPSLAPPMGSVY